MLHGLIGGNSYDDNSPLMPQTSRAGKNGDYHFPFARAGAFNQQHSLPGAKLKLSTVDRESDAGPDDRADHMVRCMGRIVVMTELDVRDDPLEHFHKVFVSPFD